MLKWVQFPTTAYVKRSINMRMWLVNPKIMCRKHLLGEHVEHHMFFGTMLREKSINGYIENNLFEPTLLVKRHDDLVAEMLSRGYNHNSPLEVSLGEFLHFQDVYRHVWKRKIDRVASLNELINRCPECNRRYNEHVSTI